MVEPVSLQQILSMGTQVEKVQQVQQNQHDVTARDLAQGMREARDEKKIEVPVQEESSQMKSVDDQPRQKSNQERESKQKKEEKTKPEEDEHGNRVNIVV